DGEEISVFAPYAKIDSFFLPGQSSATLSNSRNEAMAINDLVGARVYIDEAATLEQFENSLSSSIIHIASHAENSSVSSEQSRILFNANESLFQFEIALKKIQAQLITLSACETFSGRSIPAEGALSLARAFFQAGAKSVIASLWPVDDASTSEIMINFYKHLKKGKRKDTALRLAKQDFLANADPRWQHPYYWAGFIAIGDMSPLDFGGTPSWIYWLMAVTFLGFGITVWWRRFRS
ncbi:MAG: CHAT domain-containing protein, partial [Saprospiraceae bacterium]|nr:CHAT domain-containing protein [Saprospiraceae bacterium]